MICVKKVLEEGVQKGNNLIKETDKVENIWKNRKINDLKWHNESIEHAINKLRIFLVEDYLKNKKIFLD